MDNSDSQGTFILTGKEISEEGRHLQTLLNCGSGEPKTKQL